MSKIAILYTAFLRDGLMYKTIQSIVQNNTSNCIILIGDQNPTEQKLHELSSEGVYYYGLPFNCGLSYARNYLVAKAKMLGTDYCLLMADSINLEEPLSKLNDLIPFFETYPDYGIIGLNLKGRVSWQWDIDLIPNKHFYLSKPKKEYITFNGIKFQPLDVVKNFFLAKTDILLDCMWDNELALLEHEDFFWRLKQMGIKVAYTEYYSASHIYDRPEEYNNYRKRMYSEFKRKLQQKYGISGWVTYEKTK